MPFRGVYHRQWPTSGEKDRERCKVGVVLVNELYDGFMGRGDTWEYFYIKRVRMVLQNLNFCYNHLISIAWSGWTQFQDVSISLYSLKP